MSQTATTAGLAAQVSKPRCVSEASGLSGDAHDAASRVLFSIGGLYSRSNGIAWIMRDLAAALGRAGWPVEVVTADRPGRASVGDLFDANTRFTSRPGRWFGGLSLASALEQPIDAAMRTAEVVHTHSLWMYPTHQAIRAASAAGTPVVLTAHGALEPYSLQRSRWKKQLVRWLFQDADFAATDCIHVNSRREGEKVRAAGFRQPLAVIPNGITALPTFDAIDGELFLKTHPELRGRRLMLFMSRLHQKKGLGHFLPAWADVAADFPDWHLVVAGPDRGFEATARDLVVGHGLAERVTFTGALHGKIQQSARSASELFVLPSFSEGFSMAVLEAMAAGLPVLMTPECNFGEAAAAGAAVEYDATRAAMREGLHELLSRDEESLDQMGQIGSDLVRAEYDWDTIAESTIELYQWLGGGGGRSDAPAFVQFP